MDEKQVQTESKLDEAKLQQINSLYDEGEDSYLIFSINENRYTLKGSQILQIVSAPKIRKLPFVPNFIEGILNVHGTPFAAVNTLLMNGEKDSVVNGQTYIVLKRDDDQFSIHVSNIELFFEPEKEEVLEDKVKYKHDFIQLFDANKIEKNLVEALSGDVL